MIDNNFMLSLRVLSLALFDWSLALVCGWLLATYWLRYDPWTQSGSAQFTVRFPSLRAAAVLMAFSLAAQFYFLAVALTGQASLAQMIILAPAVASTHGGRLTLSMFYVSILLLFADALGAPKRAVWIKIVMVLLVLVIIALHSAVGHAAVDGNFTAAELLQFLHLSGMAVWVGGVAVTGFSIAPQLAAARSHIDAGYLRTLSGASTTSVIVVLLSGACKSWIGLDRDLSALNHTLWGRILICKLCLVLFALMLGFLHHRWARRDERLWTQEQTALLLRTLEVEAYCLSLVIVVSAWLSSVDPIGM